MKNKNTKEPTLQEQLDQANARIADLENQMTVCLRFMRRYAEKDLSGRDPTFAPRVVAQA